MIGKNLVSNLFSKKPTSGESEQSVKYEGVERALNELSNAWSSVPAVNEVRVFGSYNNGNWNPDRSDIDIYVEVSDERFSYYRDMRFFAYSHQESVIRENLRDYVMSQLTEEYTDRFNVHILTPNDLKKLWNHDEGRGPFGKNAKSGRLLYPVNSDKGVN